MAKIIIFLLSFFDFLHKRKIKNFLKKKNFDTFNIIFDIGAHKGETTLKFAGDFPSALIRSFEPVSENYHSLKNNCSHLKNQSSHNIALGEENKKTKIFLQGASVIHSLRDDLNKPSAEDSKSEDIEVKTIDYVINDLKNAGIDLLKIDKC